MLKLISDLNDKRDQINMLCIIAENIIESTV